MVRTAYAIILFVLLLILFNNVGYGQSSVHELKNSPSYISYTNSSDNIKNSNKLKFKSSYHYISPQGYGNIGSQNKPSKNISAIAEKLKPGDVILIAAGTYTESDVSDKNTIKVPVSIYGGYSLDFLSRDPWGKYKTIITGASSSIGLINIEAPRLEGNIQIDGIILKNNAKSSSINIKLGRYSEVKIKNCLIINKNSESTINIQINRNSEAIVEDNVIMNTVGESISLKPICFNNKDKPKLIIKNNTFFSNSKNDIFSNSDMAIIINTKNTKIFTKKHNLDLTNKLNNKANLIYFNEIELDNALKTIYPVNSTGFFR